LPEIGIVFNKGIKLMSEKSRNIGKAEPPASLGFTEKKRFEALLKVPVTVPRKVVPYFRTGKEMRERLNRREE
jgi:hypothetical protein